MVSRPAEARLWPSALWTAAAIAAMTSPSTMMVNSPYRSLMWPGCQGVARPRNSAQAGTASSAATRTAKLTRLGTPVSQSEPIQPSWTTVMPIA